jgi:hypothetical protein
MANLNPDKLVGFLQKILPNVDGDKIVAWVRTVVPTFVGGLLTQLIVALPNVAAWLDDMYSGWQVAVGVFLTSAVIGLYYALARKIESKYPKAGKWLLGSAAKPIYVSPSENVTPDDGDWNV